MRKALEPGLRLAMTLPYLATSDSYTSLQYGFRVARSTISLIVPKICEAIIRKYVGEVMRCPSTPEEWKNMSEDYFAPDGIRFDY